MARTSFFAIFFVLLAGSLPAQLLLNGGFEETTLVEGESRVTHWSIDATGGSFVEDAHSGKRALSISNWYVWVRGWACYGEGDLMGCKGETLSALPEKLTGWYKFVFGKNGGANDSAVCFITITNPPNTEGKKDTVAFIKQLLGPSDQYTPFEVLIPYQSNPKPGFSVVLQFLSSEHGDCEDGSGGKCLYLTLDDLALVPLESEETNFLRLTNKILGPKKVQLSIETNRKGIFPCQLTVRLPGDKLILVKTVQAKEAAAIRIKFTHDSYEWNIKAADGSTYDGYVLIE